jgi:hypothetical protein
MLPARPPPVLARHIAHMRVGACLSSLLRQVSAPIRAHASELLKAVILPSCQWRAGRVAQAVRALAFLPSRTKPAVVGPSVGLPSGGVADAGPPVVGVRACVRVCVCVCVCVRACVCACSPLL